MVSWQPPSWPPRGRAVPWCGKGRAAPYLVLELNPKVSRLPPTAGVASYPRLQARVENECWNSLANLKNQNQNADWRLDFEKLDPSTESVLVEALQDSWRDLRIEKLLLKKGAL